MDEAVTATVNTVNLTETLVVVTSDKASGTYFAGYPGRNNPILDFCRGTDGSVVIAQDGKNYTTLGYASGPGGASRTLGDPIIDPQAHDYIQEAVVPRHRGTRGGQDVGVW